MNVETNSHSASPTVVLGGIAAPKLRAVRPVAGMLARRSWIVRGRPRPTPLRQPRSSQRGDPSGTRLQPRPKDPWTVRRLSSGADRESMVSDCRLAIRTYGLSGRSSPPRARDRQRRGPIAPRGASCHTSERTERQARCMPAALADTVGRPSAVGPVRQRVASFV